MSTTDAIYASYLYEWLHSQPELDQPRIYVKALGQGRDLSFRCIGEAS